MTDAGQRITTAIRGHLASTTTVQDAARALASKRAVVGETGSSAVRESPADDPTNQKG